MMETFAKAMEKRSEVKSPDNGGSMAFDPRKPVEVNGKETENSEAGTAEAFDPRKPVEVAEGKTNESLDTGKHYVSDKVRLDRTPVDGEHGKWEGKRGDSKYIPSDETEKGKTVCDKLAEKGLDGIEYRDNEVGLSKCAEATVTIDHMTDNRPSNFRQADAKCAEQWNKEGRDGKTDWTARDVHDWRHKNRCSWHERSDTKTMDLVDTDIHEYFKHSGGCAECRARDAGKTNGGGFDE